MRLVDIVRFRLLQVPRVSISPAQGHKAQSTTTDAAGLTGGVAGRQSRRYLARYVVRLRARSWELEVLERVALWRRAFWRVPIFRPCRPQEHGRYGCPSSGRHGHYAAAPMTE